MVSKKDITIKAVGVMSGTSLDGLDLAAVEFTWHGNNWDFELREAETISYNQTWQNALAKAQLLSGEKLTALDVSFGKFIGEAVRSFIARNNFDPNLIASHGHTVFHQPENRFTLQIGHGESIAKTCHITTISDFRSGDVALGGQGAPLVPIGDQLLFPAYDYCLNLGGFANVSYQAGTQRVAFDNCPVNLVINHFAQKEGRLYDKNGELGRTGQIHNALLEDLNKLEYYRQQPPKSLGREWVEQVFLPVIKEYAVPNTDIMRTLYEHIAIQISRTLHKHGKMLVTGGGARNLFLIECLKKHCRVELSVPSAKIIDYKEAIIFAFLGVLRMQGQDNCLASVTGASRDSSGGLISIP